MIKKSIWKVMFVMILMVTIVSLEFVSIRNYIETKKHVENHMETSVKTSVNSVIKSKGIKRVYLTFDDGPSLLTQEYLDILKKHEVKATFFLVGQQIQGELKKVVEREIQEGHEIGIHTYTHKPGEIYQSAESYYMDVKRVRELLEKEFQYTPVIWRFPWGSSNCYINGFKSNIVERLERENLLYVDWNVSGEDSVGNPTERQIVENIKKDCFLVEEPVVLLHDSDCNEKTLQVLEEIILLFKQEGYEFATISQRKKLCQFGK